MLRGMKMFCGVFVLGRVTTSDMTAAQAQAQMHPAIAHLQALFAAPGLWFHVLDLIEVSTVFRHAFSREITLQLELEFAPGTACLREQTLR
jgi:hypothetical protein